MPGHEFSDKPFECEKTHALPYFMQCSAWAAQPSRQYVQSLQYKHYTKVWNMLKSTIKTQERRHWSSFFNIFDENLE